MGSVRPLYDQVRQRSSRARARERALAWLRQPSYAVAAVAGASFGVGLAIVAIAEHWLPSLNPLPPLTGRQALAQIAWSVVSGAVFTVITAALLRLARWAYYRARFGARAT